MDSVGRVGDSDIKGKKQTYDEPQNWPLTKEMQMPTTEKKTFAVFIAKTIFSML